MGFGEQLGKLIVFKKTSVYAIEKATEIKWKSLNDYIKKGVDPGFSMFVKICKHFQIEPGYFLTDSSPEEFLEASTDVLPMVYLSEIPPEKREFVIDLLYRYARDYQSQLSHEKFEARLRIKTTKAIFLEVENLQKPN